VAPIKPPFVYGPEDAAGQIVAIDGAVYEYTDTGRTLISGTPADVEATRASMRAAMQDPALGRNPTGNPYAP
jgi:hypothetical protein